MLFCENNQFKVFTKSLLPASYGVEYTTFEYKYEFESEYKYCFKKMYSSTNTVKNFEYRVRIFS